MPSKATSTLPLRAKTSRGSVIDDALAPGAARQPRRHLDAIAAHACFRLTGAPSLALASPRMQAPAPAGLDECSRPEVAVARARAVRSQSTRVLVRPGCSARSQCNAPERQPGRGRRSLSSSRDVAPGTQNQRKGRLDGQGGTLTPATRSRDDRFQGKRSRGPAEDLGRLALAFACYVRLPRACE